MKTLIKVAALVLLSAFSLQPSALFGQGSLTPPGAPAPQFKTLSQVEPRTPVDTVNTPGDSANEFIISQPGSYYLTSNLPPAVLKSGIAITANNVTLDLGGFSVMGAGSSQTGIAITGPSTNIVIRNGIISGWSVGGIRGTNVVNCQIENVILWANAPSGVELSIGGYSFLLRDCISCSNNFYGYNLGSHATVINCKAIRNRNNGIFVGANSVVEGCNSSGNLNDGTDTLDSSLVMGCTTSSNKQTGISVANSSVVTHCNASFNGASGFGVGIFGLIRTVISDCSANENAGDGINLGGDSTVLNCHASHNGHDGIVTTSGSGSRIDGNQVRDNASYGIAAGLGDAVVRNFAGNNFTNFLTSAGANIGPIGSPAASTSPWANIIY